MSVPRVGMMATVRNRRGLVTEVEPYDSQPQGRQHIVRVEYTDSETTTDERLLWEHESGARLLEPRSLPKLLADPPMESRDFDGLLRSARWAALTPFLPIDSSRSAGGPSIAAPFYGAVQVEDFQLVPLLRALRMPRVSLLLADDVGLGKTIEAGLVLTELLIRRRLRRILVLSPASLTRQWRQELMDKFALDFDLVDRQETHTLRKRLGLDSNPWRVFPRIICSYHYLRQPDVLEELLATCRGSDSNSPSPNLPWDLLIVDEAHNLMPSNFGEDSGLCKMLRQLSPYFEHKLFLTATPHNGHTRSFSGLLEQLDPVRFTQTSEFSPAERQRTEQVVVRRLKREINELDDSLNRPRRFATRHLRPAPLYFSREERAVSAAFAEFRAAVRSAIARSDKSARLAGAFALEVLNKRLLSCPWTFGESWRRFRSGLGQPDETTESDVQAAIRASREETDDDRESEQRSGHAVQTVGAWLKPIAEHVRSQALHVDSCLEALGISPQDESSDAPRLDARLDRLIEVIKEHLRIDRSWRDDERLIIFTEYKTTLDYLDYQLRSKFSDQGAAVRTLYGELDQRKRDAIKTAFNDPSDPVRILIATDAASEGLNLQETARLLFHYEIPWNPSRLEQRNGRLDRHGQARDVFVYHFTSEDDADLKFMSHVIKKVEEIREDLGSMGEVFDAAFERRFLDQEDAEAVQGALDHDLEAVRGRAEIPRERQTPQTVGLQEAEDLEQFRRDIDLSADALRDTLEVALGMGVGYPRLEGPDARGRMRLLHPLPTGWSSLVDDSLRLAMKDGGRGPIPALVFDPSHFVQSINGRPVFRPSPDTVLLHLGHPVFRHALAAFARARFPGGDGFQATRWIVRHGAVPSGSDALLLLSVEELAVNELREPFHHWVRTHQIPIRDWRLGERLPYLPAGDDKPSGRAVSPKEVEAVRDLWLQIEADVQALVRTSLPEEATAAVTELLVERRNTAFDEEKERFRHRIQEVRRAMSETTIAKLEKERDKLLQQLRQTALFESLAREKEAELRDLEGELERRRSHYSSLADRLEEEQERVLERMLPNRYTLRDKVQVFPVTVEIRLPEVSQ